MTSTVDTMFTVDPVRNPTVEISVWILSETIVFWVFIVRDSCYPVAALQQAVDPASNFEYYRRGEDPPVQNILGFVTGFLFTRFLTIQVSRINTCYIPYTRC